MIIQKSTDGILSRFFRYLASGKNAQRTEPESSTSIEVSQPAMVCARRKVKVKLPPNAYSSWEPQEDDQLVREFKRGKDITAIAESHSRTEGSIRSRLYWHRLLP